MPSFSDFAQSPAGVIRLRNAVHTCLTFHGSMRNVKLDAGKKKKKKSSSSSSSGSSSSMADDEEHAHAGGEEEYDELAEDGGAEESAPEDVKKILNAGGKMLHHWRARFMLEQFMKNVIDAHKPSVSVCISGAAVDSFFPRTFSKIQHSSTRTLLSATCSRFSIGGFLLSNFSPPQNADPLRCEDAKAGEVTDGMRSIQAAVEAEIAAPFLAEQAKVFEAKIADLQAQKDALEAEAAADAAHPAAIAMIPAVAAAPAADAGDSKEEKKAGVAPAAVAARGGRKRRRTEADLLFDELTNRVLADLAEQRDVEMSDANAADKEKQRDGSGEPRSKKAKKAVKGNSSSGR